MLEKREGGEVSRGFDSKYALGFIKLISQCSPGIPKGGGMRKEG